MNTTEHNTQDVPYRLRLVLSVKDVADICDLHPESVRRLIRTGKLPATDVSASARAGRPSRRPTWRVRPWDLQRWLDEGYEAWDAAQARKHG